MIKLAIIEDEENMLEIIYDYVKSSEKMLKDCNMKMQIERFTSAEQFLEGIDKRSGYDILLVDIGLPKMNGVELGKIVRRKYPEIYFIFLTAHIEFAVDSYRIGAYQYILKEEAEKRLPIMIQDIVKRISRDNEGYRWVGTNLDKQRIYYKEIICIRKDKKTKYVEYITTEGVYKERISLNQLLGELDNEIFMLVGRSNIINMNHIVRLKGVTIYLEKEEKIIVNAPCMEKIKQNLNTYWRNKW